MDEKSIKRIGKALKKAGEIFNDEPSEQVLLAEYQVGQQEANAAGSYTFQSGIIFFTSTLTLAGAVVGALTNNIGVSPYRLLLFSILGGFSIALLYAWKKYLRRPKFIRDVTFYRLAMIEKKLDMRKNLYIRFLDEATEENWGNEKWLPLNKKERETVWQKFKDHAGRKPRGFRLVDQVTWFAIIAWTVLILIEVILNFSPLIRHFLLDC